MRPGWKKVAEYADNKNFVRDQVRDAFERCEEETGASAGPAQKRMENFMASPGPDSFVAKWIDEARS